MTEEQLIKANDLVKTIQAYQIMPINDEGFLFVHRDEPYYNEVREIVSARRREIFEKSLNEFNEL